MKVFSQFLLDPTPATEAAFDVLLRIKILEKLKLFTTQVLLSHVNTMNKLMRKMSMPMGSFCCILYRKAKKDLDHLFRSFQFARSVWNHFNQEFDLEIAHQKGVRETIKDFLLHPPFKERLHFKVGWSVCPIVAYLRGEKQQSI